MLLFVVRLFEVYTWQCPVASKNYGGDRIQTQAVPGMACPVPVLLGEGWCPEKVSYDRTIR